MPAIIKYQANSGFQFSKQPASLFLQPAPRLSQPC